MSGVIRVVSCVGRLSRRRGLTARVFLCVSLCASFHRSSIAKVRVLPSTPSILPPHTSKRTHTWSEPPGDADLRLPHATQTIGAQRMTARYVESASVELPPDARSARSAGDTIGLDSSNQSGTGADVDDPDGDDEPERTAASGSDAGRGRSRSVRRHRERSIRARAASATKRRSSTARLSDRRLRGASSPDTDFETRCPSSSATPCSSRPPASPGPSLASSHAPCAPKRSRWGVRSGGGSTTSTRRHRASSQLAGASSPRTPALLTLCSPPAPPSATPSPPSSSSSSSSRGTDTVQPPSTSRTKEGTGPSLINDATPSGARN